MFKTRFLSLFAVLVFAGLVLAACAPSAPSGLMDVSVSSTGQSAQVEFAGVIEAMAPDQWTIQGYTVMISPQTVIEGSFAVGDSVHVYAIVDESGVVTATRIEAYSETTSTPEPPSTEVSPSSDFEFVGIVESMGADQWVVAGQTFLITPQTNIKDNVAVGDVVKVHAFLDENGAFVASEIELASFTSDIDPSTAESTIELYGVVEAIATDSWTVAGQQFIVNAQTIVKDVIAVGDRVKVHLFVAADNSWVALEIELEDSDGSSLSLGKMELFGAVESISDASWVIGGKTFIVTSQTEIKGAPAVGDWVKVEAIINSDGTLTATEIDKAASPDSDGNDQATQTPDSNDDNATPTLDSDNDNATPTPRSTATQDSDDDDEDATETPDLTSTPDSNDDDESDND